MRDSSRLSLDCLLSPTGWIEGRGMSLKGSYREGRGVSRETLMKYLGMKWGLFEKKAVILRKNSGFADLPE